MSTRPLISVLIRTKDRPTLLCEALQSVLRQSWDNLEIIIVNDGGEDVSAQVIPQAADNIHWYNNTGDLGRSHAANLAMAQATGQYCLFLDDDDSIDPAHLQNLADALAAHPEHVAAYSAVRVMTNGVKADKPDFCYPFDAVRLMIENYIPIHAVLFRRALIDAGLRFDPAFDRFEDWDFWLQAAERHTFVYVDKCTATYRVDSASGFGAKDDTGEALNEYRIAVYRKWLPRWPNDKILAIVDSSREFPRIAVLSRANSELKDQVSQLNAALLARQETLLDKEGQVSQLNAALLARQETLLDKEDQVSQLNAALLARQETLRDLEDQVSQLNAALLARQETLRDKEDQVSQLNAALLARQETLRDKIAELDRTYQALYDAQNQAAEYVKLIQSMHEKMQTIFSSLSWKITKPVRALGHIRYHWQDNGLFGVLNMLSSAPANTAEEENPTAASAPESPVSESAPEHPIATSYEALDFPAVGDPEFSIVIPCHNQHLYTFHCLKSILDHLADERVEVIVVDDESSDETSAMLAGISGITVLRNDENMGFIKTCNRGAEAANGEYLVLLNNDTEVTAGWLRAMRDTFTEFPDAGMVGAKLLYADNGLQEAGGIVWQDGSAWNFGRRDDPSKPEYSYCRRVDYCSGACLMLPLADFRALNGFDELYVPAYYEDTDLAFRIRDTGKQVYFQPNARVYHFEGITSGTDLTSGMKQYQVVNRDKFFERWQQTLASHRPNGKLPLLEKDRGADQRILVIDARVLMPDQDSGSLRMFNVLKILRNMGHKVTFVPSNLHYDPHYTPLLQAAGIECRNRPHETLVEDYLEQHGSEFNTVILSRADYADRYINPVREHCPAARIVFDTVDLHFLREQREAELSGKEEDMNSATLRKVQELNIARKADITLVVSPVEIELFREEAPDVDVRLLSNIHSIYPTAGSFAERQDILFIGGYEHPPNVDAMTWFLDEIMPRVVEANPAIRLHIVGGHLPEALAARASDNVLIDGFVADITPLFNSIRLSIAPLRYGAGVKGKINSSLSYGVPMVATSMAAEGMGLVHEKDILIADDPEAFAREVVRLYDDEALWQQLSVAGKQNIEDRFSFALAEKQLRAVLE